MNKKAWFFPILVVFLLVMVISIKLILDQVPDIQATKYIGDVQSDLFSTYKQGEVDLFNLDSVANYSSYKAIENLSSSGGVKELCDNKWKFDDECEPNFEAKLLELFKFYMKYYEYEVKEVKIEDNFLIGSLDDFVYESLLRKVQYTYTLNADFKQELSIDLPRLEKLKQDIETCLRNNQDLGECTDEEFEQEDQIVKFDIESDKKIMVFTDKIEIKNSIFKFIINLDDTGIETEIF